MDEISTALITRSLDALHQRYLYTAQNIANANTPDYRPVRVSFEDSLREAARHGSAAIAAVTPHVFTEESEHEDSAMRLDLELATASQTSSRYRTLVELLARQMSLHRAALGSGS